MCEHAVSAVLVREEGNKQLHVYYVRKSLLDAETRYSHLEKLALAFVIAARKLRPYFKAHQIVVVSADFVAEFSPTMLPALKQELSLRNEKGAVGEWILPVDGSSNVEVPE